MSYLAKQFRTAVSANDSVTTAKRALEMLQWGGVLNRNRERIFEMGEKSPAYYKWFRERLDLNRAALGSSEQIFIN